MEFWERKERHKEGNQTVEADNVSKSKWKQ
jgi:hypothetical protein